MARSPAVAGTFYDDAGTDLERHVGGLVRRPATGSPARAIGAMVPHAAYAFSGAVAGRVFGGIEVPSSVVILAPNHTGLGHPAAVGTDTPWLIPGGAVEVDLDLAHALVEAAPELSLDDLAHASDHAVEVQLPFLHAVNPAVRFVPVCLRTMSYAMCESIGRALAGVVAARPDPVLLLASSDLNHHEPRRVAERKDRMVLERIQDLDPRGLYAAVVDHHVSMCGFVPAVVMLIAALALGARHAEVVAYATSGDVNHDESSVVGYAGVIVGRERPKREILTLK